MVTDTVDEINNSDDNQDKELLATYLQLKRLYDFHFTDAETP